MIDVFGPLFENGWASLWGGVFGGSANGISGTMLFDDGTTELLWDDGTTDLIWDT